MNLIENIDSLLKLGTKEKEKVIQEQDTQTDRAISNAVKALQTLSKTAAKELGGGTVGPAIGKAVAMALPSNVRKWFIDNLKTEAKAQGFTL